MKCIAYLNGVRDRLVYLPGLKSMVALNRISELESSGGTASVARMDFIVPGPAKKPRTAA